MQCSRSVGYHGGGGQFYLRAEKGFRELVMPEANPERGVDDFSAERVVSGISREERPEDVEIGNVDAQSLCARCMSTCKITYQLDSNDISHFFP